MKRLLLLFFLSLIYHLHAHGQQKLGKKVFQINLSNHPFQCWIAKIGPGDVQTIKVFNISGKPYYVLFDNDKQVKELDQTVHLTDTCRNGNGHLLQGFYFVNQDPPAAPDKITIHGTIVDSLSKKPLDYATVTLINQEGDAMITSTLTNQNGEFKLEAAGNLVYYLFITQIGYRKMTLPVPAGPAEFEAGKLILAPDNKALKEVSVSGKNRLLATKGFIETNIAAIGNVLGFLQG